MGEDQGNVGSVTTDEARSAELRREIEQTREELGETAAALGAKADVKGRAKDRVEEIKSNVAGKKDEFAGKASDVTPASAGTAATHVHSAVKANPVPFAAIGALLVGFAVGRLSARQY